MTWNEYLDTLPDGEGKEMLKKQVDYPNGVFKYKVKCCYNCPYWAKDITLMGDYAFNACYKQDAGKMIRWDFYCEKYAGDAEEENMLMQELKKQKLP